MVHSGSDQPLATVLLQLADDHLILGHRVSEWCGHAPMLEEDLSMPNMALDLLGQAQSLYDYVGELDRSGRTHDDFAYRRTDREYLNCLLVERPNTDFAHTMLRQYYFASFMQLFWAGCVDSKDERVVAIAAKAIKEISYHVRHSGEWVIRLGDGTDESAQRMRSAAEALYPYVDELFQTDEARTVCAAQKLIPDTALLRDQWQLQMSQVFSEAKLACPEQQFEQSGGREGRHTEDFGFLLAELQYLQRTFPGAQW